MEEQDMRLKDRHQWFQYLKAIIKHLRIIGFTYEEIEAHLNEIYPEHTAIIDALMSFY